MQGRGNMAGDTQTSYPVEQDEETMKFIADTSENLLLDKVIRREIF